MELSELEKLLRNAWCRETSSSSGLWTQENPALGQCAVTSLVVNDYFGGKIVWAEALVSATTKISHYFNSINGTEFDLTRTQFPAGTIIPAGVDKLKGYQTTRDYILSFPATKQRYELLKRKIKEAQKTPAFASLVLKCHDLESSKQFYELLGFNFAPGEHDDGPPSYFCTLGDFFLELYFGCPDDKSTDALIFEVRSLKKIVDKCEQAGHVVRAPEGCKQLYDPDGRIVLLRKSAGTRI